MNHLDGPNSSPVQTTTATTHQCESSGISARANDEADKKD